MAGRVTGNRLAPNLRNPKLPPGQVAEKSLMTAD
jgi:hypothetical protein